MAALAITSNSVVASAQTLEPPKLTSGDPPPYPSVGAATATEATVELELIISSEGAVVDAQVVVSAGAPFDDVALDAVRTFVFQPALRDGKAVTSKIRYRMVFTPPAAPSTEPEPQLEEDAPPTADPPVDEAPSDAPTAEFRATARVSAPSSETTTRTLEGSDLRSVAGTRGDVLRGVELMPGVARPPAGAGVLIIRGSSPGDTEVEIDGVSVPRLYHFGGLTSFVQGRLIDRIDLYPGNFSARYGRKMGGIVEVTTRDPDHERFHAMADVNLLDSSVLVEGPVTRSLSLAVAAKRSYVDAYLSAIADDADFGIATAPVYYDYQMLASWRPTDRDHVRVNVYGSSDDMKLVLKHASDDDPSVRGNLSQATSFHRAQARWLHRFDRVEQDLSVTVGPFHIGVGLGDAVAADGRGYQIYGRAEWKIPLGERLRLVTGLDSTTLLADMSYFGPPNQQQEGAPDANRPLADRDTVSLARPISISRPAAYAELGFEPTDGLRVMGGVRADWYGDVEEGSVDPRLTVRYELSSSTTLKGGVGLFSQPPDFGESLPLIGNPELGLARAQHYTLGVEQSLGMLSFSVEGFHKRLHGLVVNSTVPGENLANDGEGRIWGAEVSGRVQGKRGFAFLSYTLSRSRRNDHGAEWRTFDWDQPHILTMAGSLRLGASWSLGGTFRYVSGNPFTPVMDSVYNASTDRYQPVYGETNSARNTDFHQLDVRVEKAWHPSWGTLAAYVDVQNVYDRANQEGRVYKYDFTENRAIPGMSLFPSIGLRGEL